VEFVNQQMTDSVSTQAIAARRFYKKDRHYPTEEEWAIIDPSAVRYADPHATRIEKQLLVQGCLAELSDFSSYDWNSHRNLQLCFNRRAQTLCKQPRKLTPASVSKLPPALGDAPGEVTSSETIPSEATYRWETTSVYETIGGEFWFVSILRGIPLCQ
jgi:hypothetical protein